MQSNPAADGITGKDKVTFKMLATISDHLNRYLELTPMLDNVLPLVCDLIGAPTGWIILLQGTELTLAATHNLPPALLRNDMAAMRWSPCRCQRALLDGELKHAINVLRCQRLEEAKGDTRSLDFHGSIPLRVKDQTLGLLNLAITGRREFSSEELDLLTLVGKSLAMAIHRAKLFANVRTSGEALHRQFSSVMETTTDLVALLDRHGNIYYLNRSGQSMLGYENGCPEDLTVHDICPGGECQPVLHQALKGLKQESVWSGETILTTSNGPLPVAVVATVHRSSDGTVDFFAITARDISTQLKREHTLHHLATHDPLTGLHNRRSFTGQLSSVLGQSQFVNGRGAVLYMDLDKLKAVNDTHGHAAGDKLITRFAGVLKRALRSVDFTARLGGDEFAAILPGVSAKQAQHIADRIVREFRNQNASYTGPVRPSVSVGIAVFPQQGTNARTILKKADQAMYSAKQQGGGAILFRREQPHETYNESRNHMGGTQ